MIHKTTTRTTITPKKILNVGVSLPNSSKDLQNNDIETTPAFRTTVKDASHKDSVYVPEALGANLRPKIVTTMSTHYYSRLRFLD